METDSITDGFESTDSLGQMIEFVDNPEPRCPCVLLLDVSASMTGPPIAALNEGVRVFKEQVLQDNLASLRAEVAIIAFNHNHSVVQEFATMNGVAPLYLVAGGGTRMAPAINEALDMVERRKQDYRDNGISYYRPMVIMITDGYPEHDTPEAIGQITNRIREQDVGRHVMFLTVAVGGADMQRLTVMMPPARPPQRLAGLDFAALFQWLSNSMSAISQSQPGDLVRLPNPDSWLEY